MKFLFIGLFFAFCGVNTDVSVSPVIFLIPPATPQISHVIPTNANYDNDGNLTLNQVLTPRPEYILVYHVTNIEDQYTGNNLYITANTPSIVETYSGADQNLYLENGVQPSFVHSPDKASNQTLVKKRIAYKLPPPAPQYFQKCEMYTFTMRAVINTGVLSQPSAPVSACASLDPSSCQTGTGCNPDYCSVAGCANPSSCAVGTICNPCKITGQEKLGCACPVGVTPPGCN